MIVSPLSLIDIHLSTIYLLFYIEGNLKKKNQEPWNLGKYLEI